MPLKKRMKTSRIDLPVVVRSEVNGAAAPSRNNAPLVIIAALGLIAAMYIARDLLIPIVCAFLTALLLRPALRRMRRWRVPDIASAFVLVGVVAMVSLLGVLTLAGQAHEWLAQAPESLRKVSSMVPTNSGPLAEMVRMQEAVNDLTRTSGAPEPVQVELHSHATAFTALGISGHFIGSVLILFVLSFFLLAFSDTLLKQAVESCNTFKDKRSIVLLLQQVENGISRYLATITVINVGLGCATAATMWAIGIRNPILWGVLAAVIAKK